MAKRQIVIVRGSPLLKSHVEGYSRKDGSYVKSHDDKRTKKADPKDEKYSHPHVVGKAENTDAYSEGHKDNSGMKFAGTQYFSTGKSGKSFHDETPVREFESEDGHRVWQDEHGRVHADGKDEVARLRAKHEAHVAGQNDEPIDDKDAGDGDPVDDEQKGADVEAPGGDYANQLQAMDDGESRDFANARHPSEKVSVKRAGDKFVITLPPFGGKKGETIDGVGPQGMAYLLDKLLDEKGTPAQSSKGAADAKAKAKGGDLTKAILNGARALLGLKQ